MDNEPGDQPPDETRTERTPAFSWREIDLGVSDDDDSELPTFCWNEGPSDGDTPRNPDGLEPPEVPLTLTIPTLAAGRFHNLDDVMLHAAFAVLRQFLETEYPGHVVWRKSDLAELEALYRWWERTWMIPRPDTDEQCLEDNEMFIRLVRIRHVLWT
jgi:hypothetical protein